MDSFQVVDLSDDGTLVFLRDQRGGNHFGSMASPTLGINDVVVGFAASPGLHLLMSNDGIHSHRVMLLHVDCPRIQVLTYESPHAVADSLQD